MSKLLQRLEDPSRSGVYRTTRADVVADAVRGSRLNFARVSLDGMQKKEDLLDRIAQALSFPEWFGRNWDALEDCLTDLSWCPAQGHVFVFDSVTPDEDVGVLIDVLASSAEFWAARHRSFFGVFVDPDCTLALADLFRES
jgi:RNAse (barnase) inhibitor barstar